MKKRTQKLAALFLTGILTTVVAAGCGGGGTSSDAGTDTSTAESTETETEGAAEVSSDDIGEPNGGAEVTLWHYFEHEADALNQMVKQYNESQSDIYIVPTFVSRDELMKQYTIGAVSGELPDIGMVDSSDMASYISLGVFEDITEYVGDWEDLDQFYEGPLASVKDAEGNIYGLPNNSNCLAIACNMDILRAAGIENPPTTWEEFREVCEKTTNEAEGVYGFAMCSISNEEGTFQYIPWLYGAGGDVTDIDSDAAVESLTFLSDLVKDGYMSKEVVNWGQGDAYNAFLAGKAAMLESGTWQIATLDGQDKDKVTFDYEYVAMPMNGENQATCIGGENFGVCAGSEYVEECADFLMSMMSAQNNADWCEIAGKLPVREDAVELKDFWTADARYKVFNDSMNFAVARGPHESWPTISEAIYTAEQSAILGEKTPEEALAEAAATIDPILEETPIATQ